MSLRWALRIVCLFILYSCKCKWLYWGDIDHTINLCFFFFLKKCTVEWDNIFAHKFLSRSYGKNNYEQLNLVPLFTTPWTVACQAPLSWDFSRQEYWSWLPFLSPGDLPNPGINALSPVLAGRFYIYTYIYAQCLCVCVYIYIPLYWFINMHINKAY